MNAPARLDAAAPRILILGGSTEGFAAAKAFFDLGYHVISSFAGRTRERRATVGATRVGGFGGAAGLAAYLVVEDISLVVDATHPFADKIKANAAAACGETGTPLIHVDRAQWTPGDGDNWLFAADVAAAAAITPMTSGVCLVTIGRQQIRHFEHRRDLNLLFRVIDPPERPFSHPHAEFLHQRGPFTIEAERALFEERGVTCLVAKNSGATAAEAKLVVARERGLPVVIVDRPSAPGGRTFGSVEEAVAAASTLLGGVVG